jgi:hypothetical protein
VIQIDSNFKGLMESFRKTRMATMLVHSKFQATDITTRTLNEDQVQGSLVVGSISNTESAELS